MQPDLALALELADAADAITLRRFRAADLLVETKPDLTPVSEADRAVEDALRHRLGHERPHDSVLGEERGSEGDGTRRWILDPIDGTRNYVRGIPVFATLIALEQAGDLQLGVASAPALGRRWWAARGAGAFVDGRPMRVSRVRRLAEAVVSFAPGGHELSRKLLDLALRSWHPRCFGDFWQHVLVAEGALDVAVDPEVSLWDLAAIRVIVEEAGGRFTDLGGVPRADGGSAVSSNGLLHEDVLAALAAG